MEKLTQAEIKILEKRIKEGGLFQLVLLGLAALAIVLLVLSLYLNWGFPAPFFVGFFGSGLTLAAIIHYFMQRKIVRDLANGVKTTIEGVIVKKEMKATEANSYYSSYSPESLEELAQYIEEKEKGIKKDYGIRDWNLNRAARSSFLIILDNRASYSVGIREYMNLQIGDRVRIICTPLSGTFLNMSKL